jgi:hypothetical protein
MTDWEECGKNQSLPLSPEGSKKENHKRTSVKKGNTLNTIKTSDL